ncbi:52 kDa repressor of the inhibitor of the protein kinase-like, partial [Aphis craccivora]
AVETLQYCDTFYPSIKVLLQIFATIPITTVTAERSFSSLRLRRLKNYMRSTMSEDRLNGLTVLHIHKHLPIDIDYVIT